jgi:hypothetical protein
MQERRRIRWSAAGRLKVSHGAHCVFQRPDDRHSIEAAGALQDQPHQFRLPGSPGLLEDVGEVRARRGQCDPQPVGGDLQAAAGQEFQRQRRLGTRQPDSSRKCSLRMATSRSGSLTNRMADGW